MNRPKAIAQTGTIEVAFPNGAVPHEVVPIATVATSPATHHDRNVDDKDETCSQPSEEFVEID